MDGTSSFTLARAKKLSNKRSAKDTPIRPSGQVSALPKLLVRSVDPAKSAGSASRAVDVVRSEFLTELAANDINSSGRHKVAKPKKAAALGRTGTLSLESSGKLKCSAGSESRDQGNIVQARRAYYIFPGVRP